jgi:hypothetical protein
VATNGCKAVNGKAVNGKAKAEESSSEEESEDEKPAPKVRNNKSKCQIYGKIVRIFLLKLGKKSRYFTLRKISLGT